MTVKLLVSCYYITNSSNNDNLILNEVYISNNSSYAFVYNGVGDIPRAM